MKNIIPLKLIVLALACVVSISEAGEPVNKEAEKVELHIKPLDPEAKGGVIRYEIPDLHRKSLNAVVSSGLLVSILTHGTKVCFEFEREELDNNEIKKLLGIGTYIVSVEPRIFKAGDTIVIVVSNAGFGN